MTFITTSLQVFSKENVKLIFTFDILSAWVIFECAENKENWKRMHWTDYHSGNNYTLGMLNSKIILEKKKTGDIA